MQSVSDTSTIIKLVRGEAIDCLGGLFDRVWIPPAVHDECQRPITRQALTHPVFQLHEVTELRFHDLGRGEREAISLAVELGVEIILTDDDKAFKRALHEMLKPVRVFDLLVIAKARQLIPSVKIVLDRMRANGEGIRDDFYQATLAKADEI